MASGHTLRTVARYEMRTLFRSWFFRIFAGLFILGIGIFNVAIFVDASGSPWLYRALPASLPYANLIILNLGQAIVAVFLSSEFLKQDKKNDTVEVIYSRSMTNSEYIFGKSLGIMAVFIILNVIILILGIGFSFLSGDSAKGILQYFLYPLLISIPTLTFILGLSFLFMSIFKNQAITFILLLGYIAVTVFYLNTKAYHLFDYIAYQVPMFHSSIGGFGNLTEILIHRGIYFFLGLGLIMITVTSLQRLPQAKFLKSSPLVFGSIFLIVGGFLMYQYVSIKKGNESYRSKLVSLNNKYVDYPAVRISKCDIDLVHKDEQIQVEVDLNITNESKERVDTIILSLNPLLNIKTLLFDGREMDYIREYQIVKIPVEKPVYSGDVKVIEMAYSGSITENTHFLDQDPELYEDNFSLEIFRLRKRYAYLKEDFVCLTSESLWYPIAGVGYASDKPASFLPDFTKYKLKIQTQKDLVAVSQGVCTNPEEGVYIFEPEFSLPKISLLIGNYTKKTLTIDSVDYSIFTLKGNDYYSVHFDSIHDTLPALIKELKTELETSIDLEYSFHRFSLAEVPIHFALDKHLWSLTSDAVQPEMVFYPEKGVIMEETDFKRRKIRSEKRMERDNEEILADELQTRVFKRFVRGNFNPPSTEWYNFDVMDRNTYSLIPNYFSFVMQLRSEDFPVLNLALEKYLKDRNLKGATGDRWFWRGISKGERMNLELKNKSLEELLVEGVTKADLEEGEEELTLHDLIVEKGNYLFTLLKARYGDEEFNEELIRFLKQNQHQPFTLEEFDAMMVNTFQTSVKEDIEKWYSKVNLPGYLVKDVKTYKVKDGEYTKYQLRFKISNPEPMDGVVTLNIEQEDPNRGRGFNMRGREPDFVKELFLPAKSAKEVGLVFTSEPARMNINTYISENLPNNINIDFSSFDEVSRAKPLDGVVDCPLFESLSGAGEIIVDNEDENFEIEQTVNTSYLKSLIDKGKESAYDYTGIRFWNPPNVWDAVLRSEFYGKYVRSARYTESGEGERKAVWNAPIDHSAYFDVYCHIGKIEIQWSRDKRKSSYNFRIHHDDGIEDITLTDEELVNGWNYMGTYYISPENAKVVLTNKSLGRIIYADAIKWIENK